YPDSMSYLRQGAPVARALFLHRFAGYYGGRSLIYSVGILPFHWNVTPWPVVIFNALLTAYVLWLVVRSLQPGRTSTSYLALVVICAAAAQVAVHTYLFGEPSLNGQRPPFVMARMIADGPGRWYLRQHCLALHVEICRHSRDLPDNVDDFLWSAHGIWQSAS